MESDVAREELFPRPLLLLALQDQSCTFDGVDNLVENVEQNLPYGLARHVGAVVHEVASLSRELLFVEGEDVTWKVGVRRLYL